jgi:hypothetical protein
VRTGLAESESLAQLRELVAAEGGELAAAIVDRPAVDVFGPVVAEAERCRDRARDYAVLLESILEGYLLHYGVSRLIDPPDDDLRLLAGDYLYALGLSRLAALGDLPAVRELADVIALCAEAHAGLASARDAAAIWMLGTIGVAGGPWDRGEEAKEGLRGERPNAPVVALEAALRRAEELGIALQARQALIALEVVVSGDSPST